MNQRSSTQQPRYRRSLFPGSTCDGRKPLADVIRSVEIVRPSALVSGSSRSSPAASANSCRVPSISIVTVFSAAALRTKSVNGGLFGVMTSCARRPPAIQKPVGSG